MNLRKLFGRADTPLTLKQLKAKKEKEEMKDPAARAQKYLLEQPDNDPTVKEEDIYLYETFYHIKNGNLAQKLTAPFLAAWTKNKVRMELEAAGVTVIPWVKER